VAINEAQEDHELLGTARALRSDQKVKVKAVTETATLPGGRDREGGDRRPTPLKKCVENPQLQLCTAVSFLRLPTVHFVKKENCLLHKKKKRKALKN
jgi:hypothetical protein